MERIAEVVFRRVSRWEEPGWEIPDLIIIDGGKLQLQAAYNVLKTFSFDGLEMIGLVKDRNSRKYEGIILSTGAEIRLEPDSEAKRILDRIRDEAHRFAIKYHRTLREKKSLHSPILDIPGIGKKRQQILISNFGSIEQIRNTGESDLAAITGIGKAVAKQIIHYFEKQYCPGTTNSSRKN